MAAIVAVASLACVASGDGCSRDAAPAASWSEQRDAEETLRTTLTTLRACLQQYFADHDVCPESLDELVRAGYLYDIPVDPITRSAGTWVAVLGGPGGFEGCRGRVAGVRSGSERSGLDGRLYRDW